MENQQIGFKMDEQLGFEVFLNQKGCISIKQKDWLDEEIIIVLTKEEAKKLHNFLPNLIEISKEIVEAVYEGEEDER